MKTVLLWDPRFPRRAPLRLTLAPEIASAAVRAGVAAAANPAEQGELAAGPALDSGLLTEVVVEHGFRKELARVMLPYDVVLVGAGLGMLASIGTPVTLTPAVTISAAQAQNEGSSGSTIYTFTVTRSVTAGPVSVPWTFSAGSTSASDYPGGVLPTGGAVAMANGVATGTFAVTVSGDSTIEPDELFLVALNAPAGYALGSPSSATGTILNDDAPQLGLTGALAFNVGAAAGTLVANITGVPSGVTPTLTPNDGRLVVAGDEGTGWKVVVGLSASSAGPIAITVAATGATSASATVTVSAAISPVTTGLVADWDVESITPVADGALVASWTDSINGQTVTAAAGKEAVYKTNRYGGKPALLFGGAHWLNGSCAQVQAAVTSNNFTIMVFYGRTQSTTFGFLFSVTNSTGLNVCCNGSVAGEVSGGTQIPFIGAGFSTGGHMHTSAYPANGASTAPRGQVVVNGSVIAHGTSASFTPTTVGIGASAIGTGPAKAEIQRIRVWNRKLTLAEWMQEEVYWRTYYGEIATAPWNVAGYYQPTMGDSITAGNGLANRASKTLAAQIAAINGKPVGSFSNLGLSGAVALTVKTIAQFEDVTRISSLTGVLTKFTYFEFYNIKANSAASQNADTQTVLSYLKTTPGDKTILGTTPDYLNRGAEKGVYTAYWAQAGNRAGFADGYAALHLDANTGIDGATPNASPFGKYMGNQSATANVTIASGSTALTVNSVTGTALAVNQTIEGMNIPAGTYLVSGSGAAWVMSAAATASATQAVVMYAGGDGVHWGDLGTGEIAAVFAPAVAAA